MWDPQKRERFQTLRQREVDGELTAAEQVELSQMIQAIEQAEATYLRPAMARLRGEREQTEAQNRALQALVGRREALVARLHLLLDELEVEHRAINEELARILGDGTTVEVGVNQ